MVDIEMVKKVAETYGIKVTQVQPGEGGMFYENEDGNKIKVNIDDLFDDFFMRIKD